jgi:hypothetical protein
MAIVPLRECKIPTLMVSPLGAGVSVGVSVGVGVTAASSAGGVASPQAFNKILVPIVAEPYKRNFLLPSLDMI